MNSRLQSNVTKVSEQVSIETDGLNNIAIKANQSPEQFVFVHKSRGEWLGFNWLWLHKTLESTVSCLSQKGLSSDTVLLVSGNYEPKLLILSLAVCSMGGRVVPISSTASEKELSELIEAHSPTHCYIEKRQTVNRCLSIPISNSIICFSAGSESRIVGQWTTIPIDDVLDCPEHPPTSEYLSRVVIEGTTIGWCDEPTDWHSGIQTLFDKMTEHHLCIAFPESAESSARDRLEIQPTHLICSKDRLVRYAKDFKSRLPAKKGLALSLSIKALKGYRSWWSRFLLERLKRLNGFSRLNHADLSAVNPINSSLSSVQLKGDSAHG
ncbi:AMP-binding protein [Vibrio penaeicida]|uniref:AMP-binding protein n=1 Tax=Vibrio penaeicida TaxID=104609 RepID=UPI000CE9ADB0|nr:AMP-binding protein [Vibrio penaeicida]